jgi:GT2 family glycosyltransferase
MEFNLRLKKAGGKILLHPNIVSYYYPRVATLKNFFLYNFKSGFWVIYSFKFVKMPLRPRHYISLIFVLSLPLSIWLYIPISLFFSVQMSFRKRDFKLLLVMPIVFFIRHFAYGLGSIWGMRRLFVN